MNEQSLIAGSPYLLGAWRVVDKSAGSGMPARSSPVCSGHHEQGIAAIDDCQDYRLERILRDSIAHERAALEVYRDLRR